MEAGEIGGRELEGKQKMQGQEVQISMGNQDQVLDILEMIINQWLDIQNRFQRYSAFVSVFQLQFHPRAPRMAFIGSLVAAIGFFPLLEPCFPCLDLMEDILIALHPGVSFFRQFGNRGRQDF